LNRTIKIISISLSLFLLACSGSRDYRTDEERAQGVTLTPEQVLVRKANRSEMLKSREMDMRRAQDRMAMQRMISCHAGHYLECIR